MSNNIHRRIAAGLGACAMAATGAVMTVGDASAESGLTYWQDGSSRFEQIIDNTTPAVGDTITITTNFQRKWSDEYIYSVKELVPACLRYIEGSGGWGSKPAAPDAFEFSDGTNGPAFVKVKAPSVTAWRVTGLGAGFGAKSSVTMKFYVRESCATGEPMSTSMHYGGSLGSGTYQDKGPAITVAKLPVVEPEEPGGENPGGENPDDGGNGSLDTGSLGSLFG